MLAVGDNLGDGMLVALACAASGTAVGSVVRDWVVRRFRTSLRRADLGVLSVNLAACVLAAALASTPASRDGLAGAFLLTGFAGGLSTWSTLAVEVAGAIRARRWGLVALHIPGAFAVAVALLMATQLLGGGAS